MAVQYNFSSQVAGGVGDIQELQDISQRKFVILCIDESGNPVTMSGDALLPSVIETIISNKLDEILNTADNSLINWLKNKLNDAGITVDKSTDGLSLKSISKLSISNGAITIEPSPGITINTGSIKIGTTRISSTRILTPVLKIGSNENISTQLTSSFTGGSAGSLQSTQPIYASGGFYEV